MIQDNRPNPFCIKLFSATLRALAASLPTPLLTGFCDRTWVLASLGQRSIGGADHVFTYVERLLWVEAGRSPNIQVLNGQPQNGQPLSLVYRTINRFTAKNPASAEVASENKAEPKTHQAACAAILRVSRTCRWASSLMDCSRRWVSCCTRST